MDFCVLAKIVLLLAMVSVSFHVCIFGLSLSVILADILFMALLVVITNWYCEYWIAKGIVVFAIIGTLTYIYMCFEKNRIYQQNVEDGKKHQS